jgi:hypothetical protein
MIIKPPACSAYTWLPALKLTGDSVMKPENVKMFPVKDVIVEDGAQEMLVEPNVQPYLTNLEARITGRGREEAAKAIADLPLERRYIWRIASSLKRAFVDFDRSRIRADLSAMNAEDFDNAVGLIERRPVQFALLLRTVFGAEEMERVLLEAIDIAKRY